MRTLGWRLGLLAAFLCLSVLVKMDLIHAQESGLDGLRVSSVHEQKREDGSSSFELVFEPESAARLQELTAQSVGENLVISAGDVRLGAFRIGSPITGDRAELTGPIAAQAAEFLRRSDTLVVNVRLE